MIKPQQSPQTALKYEVEVLDEGRVELHVPFAAGARIIIFVIPEVQDSFASLAAAAESSTGFWDNSFDDEDWNHA
jgi:hypothetical protein